MVMARAYAMYRVIINYKEFSELALPGGIVN